MNWPWFLCDRYSIWGNVLGAPSAPAAARSRGVKDVSANSSSGCSSNRVNSVTLSGYLKMSDLNRLLYASAAWA